MSNQSVQTSPISDPKLISHTSLQTKLPQGPQYKTKPSPGYKPKPRPEKGPNKGPVYKSKPAPEYKPNPKPEANPRLTNNLLTIKRRTDEHATQVMMWNTLRQTLKLTYPWQVYSLYRDQFPNDTSTASTVDDKFDILEKNQILHMNDIKVLWNKCLKLAWIRSKLMDELAVYAYTFDVGVSHDELMKAGYVLE